CGLGNVPQMGGPDLAVEVLQAVADHGGFGIVVEAHDRQVAAEVVNDLAGDAESIGDRDRAAEPVGQLIYLGAAVARVVRGADTPVAVLSAEDAPAVIVGDGIELRAVPIDLEARALLAISLVTLEL